MARHPSCQGLFDEIVTHEMLHAVGVGSIWAAKALLSGGEPWRPRAAGQRHATHQGGSAGTAQVHWSEAVFDGEMMPGWPDTAPRAGMVADPLSAITTASLKDLGYVVAARPPTDFYILG